MSEKDFTTAFTVDETPEAAYAAINNVRGWWTGDIEGKTDALGDEFTYRYEDLHYSKQKLTELVPGRKVAWQVLDSRLSFVANQSEWNGTTIVFDIGKRGDKTEIRFTHRGLDPHHECYDGCSDAWTGYIKGSLKELIESGAP